MYTKKVASILGFGLVIGALALGCNDNNNNEDASTTADSGTDAYSGTVPATLTEAQIFGILETVNNAEIEQSEIARDRSSNPQVREYAQMMIDEHRAANDRQDNLREQLGIDEKDSAIRDQFNSMNEDTKDILRNKEGAAFDQAYVNAQIEAHQKTLDGLDRDLIPAAKTEQVSVELKATRDSVAKHLDMAKRLLTADAGVVTTTRHAHR